MYEYGTGSYMTHMVVNGLAHFGVTTTSLALTGALKGDSSLPGSRSKTAAKGRKGWEEK